ncbi:hypothetical protein KRX54_04520 [Actinomycetaceae bacterium TAE3-ERU4]|nr:hypothetical protein [Actinomycetaceae bacterium TAE3-ERU4]
MSANQAEILGLEHLPSSAGKVASVLIDSVPAHLSNHFEYLIPSELEKDIKFGTQVKVSLAGAIRNAWVIKVSDTAEYDGVLSPILEIVGSFSLLTPPIYEAMLAIASSRVGIVQNLIRSAIPSRNLKLESTFTVDLPEESKLKERDLVSFSHYEAGEAFLTHLEKANMPRAVWQYLPSSSLTTFDIPSLSDVVYTTVKIGKSVLIVLPTTKECDFLAQSLEESLGIEALVIHHDLSPRERYRRYLLSLCGSPKIVIGTRSAVWTPLDNLGLIVVLGIGDSSLVSQRAPYTPAWEIACARSRVEKCALLLGALFLDTWAARVSTTGFAPAILPSRELRRRKIAKVRYLDEFDMEREGNANFSRIPPFVHRLISRSLENGPVLVSVRSRGYIPILACASCREKARCCTCGGNLRKTKDTLECSLCGKPQIEFICPSCGGNKLRSLQIGTLRTAEEFGRSFPKIPVVVSSSEKQIFDVVKNDSRIFVSTCGAEPFAEKGFAGAVILDTYLALNLPFIDASESALRDWFGVVSRVRPDGEVGLVGHVPTDISQALLRWDPLEWSLRELSSRREVGLPPATWMAEVVGEKEEIQLLYKRFEGIKAPISLFPPLRLDSFAAERARRLTPALEPYRLVLSSPWKYAGEVATFLAQQRAELSAISGTRLIIRVQPRALV